MERLLEGHPARGESVTTARARPGCSARISASLLQSPLRIASVTAIARGSSARSSSTVSLLLGYRFDWGMRRGSWALRRFRRRFFRRAAAVPFRSDGLLIMMDDMGALSSGTALRGDGGGLLYAHRIENKKPQESSPSRIPGLQRAGAVEWTLFTCLFWAPSFHFYPPFACKLLEII